MLLALGVGSLFNHSRQPTLDYRVDYDNLIIRYFAARTVTPGEELSIYYGENLWFEDTSSKSNATMLHDHMDDENTFLGNLTL